MSIAGNRFAGGQVRIIFTNTGSNGLIVSEKACVFREAICERISGEMAYG